MLHVAVCPPLLLGRLSACERAERGRCPGGRAALVPAASLAPRTPSCSSAPGMRKQTVILPIIDSLHDGPTNGGSAAQPPSTPRTPRRASPRKQSKSQEIPPHTMPQIGAQTMQALSSVKDPAVHAVIESEALHQMAQSFTKGSEWQSTAVHTEVLLQHVLEASAHLPVPNRFRTESVCALLHTQIGTLGRYEPILRQLQADIYASIFEGVSEARNGSVLHGKPYFEVARELQNKVCCSYVAHLRSRS